MTFPTVYARLTPTNGESGEKYSVSVSGVTAIVEGQKTWSTGTLSFAITPSTGGNATITFKNDSTGDVIGTRSLKVIAAPKPYYMGTHNLVVPPGKTIVVDMYPSGGGGGSSAWTPVYDNIGGSDGGDMSLSQGTNKIIAGGGKGGTGGAWGNGSSFSNGLPGVGGVNNISANNGFFTILSNQNGRSAVTGSRYLAQPIAKGYINEFGLMNNGGMGGNGVGDERWSYGGSGGSGGRLKASYTNNTTSNVTLSLVVGNSGVKSAYGSNKGTDALSRAHALVTIN